MNCLLIPLRWVKKGCSPFDRIRLCALFAILTATLVLTSCSFFSVTTESTQRYILYPAQAHDTLTSIAQRFVVRPQELAQINHLKLASPLRKGQIIRVPFRGQSLRRKREDVLGGSPESPTPQSSSVQQLKLNPEARAWVGKLLWPVAHGVFVSKFGSRWLSFHEGIDIAANQGVPIVAAHPGIVVYSGSGIRGYGNIVIVRGEGLLTVYAHNRANRARTGDPVRAGQVLAFVGSTGKSTGPHLHFETRIQNAKGSNVAVDPMVFFSSTTHP